MSGFRRAPRDRSSSSLGRPASAASGRSWHRRAHTALAVASILAVASGCDKAKQLAGAGGAEAAEPPPGARLDLSQRPEILFQVFGEREDARMIPVGVIEGGQLKPIVLASSGWKQFDGLYGKSGTSYTLYRAGRPVGSATVRQGMWERPNEPLYSLPNCNLMIPLSRVKLDSRVRLGFTVEAMASNGTLGRSNATEPRMPAAEAERISRDLADIVAQRSRIPAGSLSGLALNAQAIETRTGGPPVVVAMFTDPRAEEKVANGGKTVAILAIGEPGEDGAYQVSYSHVVNGSADDAEHRRFIDHLDVDSDGTDEIVLEGWDTRGVSFLAILRSSGGRWTESYRSRAHWCLDQAP